MKIKTGLLLLSCLWGFNLASLQAQTRALITEVDNPIAEKAIEWQNTAFIAEALHDDFKTALAATDSALLLWKKLGALPEIAKLNRYSGYLLAQLHRIPEAKNALQLAKSMFQQQKAVYGLALTHFEWGRVCLLANELDSALYYTQTALAAWQSQKHDNRILQAQLQLVYLYARQLNFPAAAEQQKEMLALKERLYLNRLTQVDYWYVQLYFSEKQSDWSSYEDQLHQYNSLVAAFAAEGSTVISFYSRLEALSLRN